MTGINHVNTVMIDDDDFDLELGAEQFSMTARQSEIPHTMHTFRDPRRALEAISNRSLRSPDLVILDGEMPGLNGPQVLERLGQLTEFGGKVVLVTGGITSNTRRLLHDALRSGAEPLVGIVKKPPSKETYLHMLRSTSSDIGVKLQGVRGLAAQTLQDIQNLDLNMPAKFIDLLRNR